MPCGKIRYTKLNGKVRSKVGRGGKGSGERICGDKGGGVRGHEDRKKKKGLIKQLPP